jgi:hypothetical protein
VNLHSVNQHIDSLTTAILRTEANHINNEDTLHYWEGYTLGILKGKLQVYEHIRNELEEGYLMTKDTQ